MLEHAPTSGEVHRLNHSPSARTVTTRFGTVPWTPDDMRAKLEEFAALYEERPIEDNSGGMSSTHCFLFWFVLQRLKPKVVIESGVWQGQGTWFIEQACPDASLYCIDLSWKHLRYRSTRAVYLDRDFQTHDWSHIPKDETVLFFDDHVDAFQRCKAVHSLGFRHAMFEDNYPHGRGDCYSLKEVMQESGHRAFPGPRAWLSRIRGTLRDRTVPPNSDDAADIRHVAACYEELPPIFKLSHTRWGDVWDDRIPTPAPLLDALTKPYEQRYLDEAKWYTWMCYVRLNQ